MQIRDRHGRPVEVVVSGYFDDGELDLIVEGAYYLDGEREDVPELTLRWIEEYYKNQIFEKWFDKDRKNRKDAQTWTGAGKYDA